MIMNGPKSVYKKEIVEEFLSRCNPYEDNEPLKFDLRAYAAYIKENGLEAANITESILAMFKI